MEPNEDDYIKSLHERVENDFMYHAPNKEQIAYMQDIRWHAKHLAHMIVNLCPNSREQNLALTNLEQAVMFANASIARNEK